MKPYKTYFYRGQDPLLTEAIDKIMDTGVNFNKQSKESGVAASTYSNWKKGKSKRTFTNTMNAALRGAGKKLKIVDDLNGHGRKRRVR